MAGQLEVHNTGPAIARTNDWRSAPARAGLLFLSINEGTLRLLVPAGVEQQLFEELPPINRSRHRMDPRAAV
jgi:hypothetical protein